MKTNLRISFAQLETPVGNEMDQLIAKMMNSEVRPFSTDDKAALDVAEWLWSQDFLVELKWMPKGFYFMAGNDGPELKSENLRAYCRLHYMPIDLEGCSRRLHLRPWGGGKTMGEAICRAAISAVYTWFELEGEHGAA